MRVALVTTSYPREPGDPAGHFVETEARALAAADLEVHVVAPGHPTRMPHRATTADVATRGGSVTVWRAGGGSLFGWPGAIPRARENPARLLYLASFALRARRALRALAPLDRAIAHFAVPSGFPLALGAARELEIVLHGSDVRLLLALPRFARERVAASFARQRAVLRFASDDLRARLLDALDPRTRAALAPLSRVELPPITIHPARGERPRGAPRGSDPPRWVACGRLIPSKRIDRAICEAARRGAHLTVIGDGPQRRALESLAAAFEPRARFTGQLPRHEALALIAEADQLVHLSEAEGAPTVIREARALGVPVLATATGDVACWAAADPGITLFHPA